MQIARLRVCTLYAKSPLVWRIDRELSDNPELTALCSCERSHNNDAAPLQQQRTSNKLITLLRAWIAKASNCQRRLRRQCIYYKGHLLFHSPVPPNVPGFALNIRLMDIKKFQTHIGCTRVRARQFYYYK